MQDEGNSLLDFVSTVSGGDYLKVEETLGDGFVRLNVAEAERRQAKHDIRSVEDVVLELLRNSRDAGAKSIIVATTKSDHMRKLVIVDDGEGIPHDMWERVFEARVTSKLESVHMDSWGVHGRGMALFSIRSNVQDAHVVNSEEDRGTSLSVSVDLGDLGERKDQSTYPVLERAEDGTQHIARGPHNIIRTVLEFALEHRDLDVYLGSPSEALATMVHLGNERLSYRDLVKSSATELPLPLRPATAADAVELVSRAAEIGLEVSERTAHRILSGAIKPLAPALKKRTVDVPPDEVQRLKVDPYRDNRGLKLAPEDVQSFQRALEAAFTPLGERYYLSLAQTPCVRVHGHSIHVRFDVCQDDE